MKEQIHETILEIGKEITQIDYNMKEDNDTLIKRIEEKLKECTGKSAALRKLTDIWYERGEKIRKKWEEEDRLWDEMFDLLEDYYREEAK